MKRKLKCFWSCGDNEIIEFALTRARLTSYEKEVLILMLDKEMTQEQVAEQLNVSVRWVQNKWQAGVVKLLNIPWVKAYAEELEKS